MSPSRLDLDAESRRALELDAVLEIVAGEAATGPGREAILTLEPMAEAAWVAEQHAVVAEGVGVLESDGRFLPSGLPDPSPILDNLAVERWHPEPLELRNLAVVLAAVSELRRRLRGLDADEFPLLREAGATLPDLGLEAAEVMRCITPEGRVEDDASPELRRIRTGATRVGERLRRMLERMVRDPAADATIRDDFVTQRNGRFVIPIRADAPVPRKGIVHASSSSGATLFVEPLETVELNNELIGLADRERDEQERLLGSWSEAFRLRLPEVRAAIDGVAAIDSIQARAAFARASGGGFPTVTAGAGIDLTDVRHPVLDRRLRERGERCVAQTFRKGPDQRVLVLSGPNTGGKTVALKTLGLAVLMAQAGLPVTARCATLPLFRQVRADIGDHQSIEADLSTYSAHVRAAARFLGEIAAPALILFDEIGTGTEPREGAALAQALLDRLVEREVSVVVTTHQAALKAWAMSTPGASSAALDFDLETLRPTYRVIHDAAGVSAGLDIASRLGLPVEVIERAREILGPDVRETEDLLNRLRQGVVDAESRERELARREDELEGRHRELERRAEREAEHRRDEVAATLGKALKEFREKAGREVAAIRDRRERARARKAQDRAELRLAASAERAKRGIAPVREGPATDGPPKLETGARVRVRSLDREGEIAAVMGDRVQVRLGTTTFTVRADDLVSAGSPAAEPAAHSVVSRAGDSDEGAVAAYELMLIGKTVDEALDEIDRFLDRATLGGLAEVRIVHGHGTGRLRAAVRSHLRGHPQVESHRSGAPREGGDGATVARLK
jgi:DNA mismatch repair protein MutS2